jgi:chorismate synthase
LTTQRKEADKVSILSGVEDGKTLGSPIALMVANQDQRPGDYTTLRTVPRPSHADYTYLKKYGILSSSGGGRASARETVARVAAGAVAEKMLADFHGIDIVAWVSSVGHIDATDTDVNRVCRSDVDRLPVRCPDAHKAETMVDLISEIAKAADSVGGIVSCVCRNVPAGLGEPIFDKLDAVLAQAMLSIPAAKGFDIGSGFDAPRMRGSTHNDLFVKKEGRLGTLTNHSGGIQGGISNGEPVVFRVAFKPTATIGLPQETADFDGNPVTLAAKGRHDPCVVPRAVPIVEAMTALVLGDMLLRQKQRIAFSTTLQ